MQSSIKYLGFFITKEGIKADDKGLDAIRNFPIPVQSFFGFMLMFQTTHKRLFYFSQATL